MKKKACLFKHSRYFCGVAIELQKFIEILPTKKTKIMYSKLNLGTGKLCLVSKSILELAKKIIIEAIASEQGKNVNDFEKYLNGWVESLNECSDGEHEYTMSDVPTQAADNLVYSNAHYYFNREPLTSAEMAVLCKEVEGLLENLIKIFQL